MKTLHPDYEFFQSQLPRLLLEHRGEFALIKDKQILGFFSSFEEALKNGYDKFGKMDFLVQEITDEKRVNYINSAFTEFE